MLLRDMRVIKGGYHERQVGCVFALTWQADVAASQEESVTSSRGELGIHSLPGGVCRWMGWPAFSFWLAFD